ncbi:MAG: diacylglycerol kinase family lipid kinase [Chloroflexi bacterium]|nr:diacylglycerol kinase family lipid kinase [Chloroflexota bacterium]
MNNGPIALIVNPASAGGATGKRWPALKHLLDNSGLRYEPMFTERRGHAAELARQAAEQGYRMIAAVGGDGTFHQVVNGLAQTEAMGHVVFGAIPSGTGNDFARNLRIPRDPQQACKRLFEPKIRRIDVGAVEHDVAGEKRRTLFLSAAGAGLDAAVVVTRARYPTMLRGRAVYAFCLFRNIFGYRNSEVSLVLDGKELWSKRVKMIVVSNGQYFGGGMKIAPKADYADGRLDVVTVGDIGNLAFLLALPSVYTGSHLGHPKVEACRAGEVEIRSREELPLQADGEILGHTPCTIRTLPGALAVLT